MVEDDFPTSQSVKELQIYLFIYVFVLGVIIKENDD